MLRVCAAGSTPRRGLPQEGLVAGVLGVLGLVGFGLVGWLLGLGPVAAQPVVGLVLHGVLDQLLGQVLAEVRGVLGLEVAEVVDRAQELRVVADLVLDEVAVALAGEVVEGLLVGLDRQASCGGALGVGACAGEEVEGGGFLRWAHGFHGLHVCGIGRLCRRCRGAAEAPRFLLRFSSEGRTRHRLLAAGQAACCSRAAVAASSVKPRVWWRPL
ncbi:MAG: hypothetical protein ACTHOG_07955 [Marmoricola sp.]